MAFFESYWRLPTFQTENTGPLISCKLCGIVWGCFGNVYVDDGGVRCGVFAFQERKAEQKFSLQLTPESGYSAALLAACKQMDLSIPTIGWHWTGGPDRYKVAHYGHLEEPRRVCNALQGELCLVIWDTPNKHFFWHCMRSGGTPNKHRNKNTPQTRRWLSEVSWTCLFTVSVGFEFLSHRHEKSYNGSRKQTLKSKVFPKKYGS